MANPATRSEADGVPASDQGGASPNVAVAEIVLKQWHRPATTSAATRLGDVVRITPDKLLNPNAVNLQGRIRSDVPLLVLLAAGKGTRFGVQPKCIQPVLGTPLARHSIEAFRALTGSKAITIVGYRGEEVAAAIGADAIFVRSDNPTGGTAFAAFEAFSVPGLIEANPLLVISMGDRVVPTSIFQRLLEAHASSGREADLTLLTARYDPPKHQGKGRVLRDSAGRVVRIVEQQDISAEPDELKRQALDSLTEGNCPLYVIRAGSLFRHLAQVDNGNAQNQYYLTDIVAAIAGEGGIIRTVTTSAAEPEYDLLCADVTRPHDLAVLEGVLSRWSGDKSEDDEVAAAVAAIKAERPAGQVASIARQLRELFEAATRDKLGFDPDQPVSIGISGGRLRIAFMHPDMGRFFGPAWQMPIGAGDVNGSEQIVVLAQKASDGRIHLFPLDPKYRESINFVPADGESMYPGENVSDWHSYEGFGTRMSETLLLSLGYFTDEEIETRKRKNLPLPPPSLRVATNMRRPFALVGNAIASMRTLREGNVGAKVQANLGREQFRGLRLACTGDIPQGGFSSSSALTVATKNALNALYGFGLTPDLLVHLACQAEYGTGVRAGSLDQATEQKGRAGQGTLISSNPADNYRVLGTYQVPSERFRVIFPYTVERDRASWRWSWGAYADTASAGGALTSGEIRKMTGKAAEIAAILVRLPHDTSFFKQIEDELLAEGRLSEARQRWVCEVLRQLPLRVSRDELKRRLAAQRDWYAGELVRVGLVEAANATAKADAAIESLFAGWREPVLRRATEAGDVVTEVGVPLRAMVAYLFGEVAKNFYLIHHPEQWITWVTRSQRGDCSVAIDPAGLPERATLVVEQAWEAGLDGPARLDGWLERAGARPYDFNRALGDAELAGAGIAPLHEWAGGSFFRGLALIDFAEAMLKRAFGQDAVAVRVNAAGQGDYFQVHVDTERVALDDVKAFLRAAFYRRFQLQAEPEFVETRAGGGAISAKLRGFSGVARLAQRLAAE